MNCDIKDFQPFFMVEQACYMFLIVGEDTFGEDYVLKFCDETYSVVWQGKSKVAVALDQINSYMITRVC